MLLLYFIEYQFQVVQAWGFIGLVSYKDQTNFKSP